jgi:hypothetical protein
MPAMNTLGKSNDERNGGLDVPSDLTGPRSSGRGQVPTSTLVAMVWVPGSSVASIVHIPVGGDLRARFSQIDDLGRAVTVEVRRPWPPHIWLLGPGSFRFRIRQFVAVAFMRTHQKAQ